MSQYDFINTSFNESVAIPVYWNNSELVIILLLIIAVIQFLIAFMLFYVLIKLQWRF